jgi:hypothetical protein
MQEGESAYPDIDETVHYPWQNDQSFDVDESYSLRQSSEMWITKGVHYRSSIVGAR